MVNIPNSLILHPLNLSQYQTKIRDFLLCFNSFQSLQLYNLNMIFIYSHQLQYINLQNAYQQLHEKYQSLASSLQATVNLNTQLQQQLQKVRSQNEFLKRSQSQEFLHPNYNNENQQSITPNNERQRVLEVKGANKIKRSIRKHLDAQIDSKTSESLYQCTYQDCNKIYTSTISMNMHIKLKHNGGTKKQREAYAKMIIDAMERGEQPPKKNINFPPNFLQQFKQTYAYQRKYKM